LGLLSDIQGEVAGVASAAEGSVVGIGSGWRVATGFVLAENRVLTSAHRVRDDETTVRFASGDERTGTVAAVDRDLGLAVIEVDTQGAEPLTWSDADPGVGAAVIALAKPGARGLRTSLGFVVANGRSIRGSRGRRIDGAIEHSAALPRGAAGGPLLDADGRLAGINVLRVEGGLIIALGTSVRPRLEQLARGETTEPRYLGVAVAPPQVARRLQRALGLPERDGVLVRAVQEGTPAARAGIERGDLIVAAGGDTIEGIDALHAAVAGASGPLSLKVVRGTDERDLEVELELEEAR
jgi:serine protease Do